LILSIGSKNKAKVMVKLYLVFLKLSVNMDIQTNLMKEYCTIRKQTEKICQPLQTEDYIIQSITDVSPPKWHLAHTTWFFETFVLHESNPDYQWYDPLFQYIFNSYYKSLTINNFSRHHRGSLARPTVKEVYQYRQAVDAAILELFHQNKLNQTLLERIQLGLHHEQQHQELLLMDVKFNFSVDPSLPIYHQPNLPKVDKITDIQFFKFDAGLKEIGHEGSTFCYDNELPLHSTYINPFSIANRLVTNAEFLEFIQAGGYQDPLLWLDDGWACVQEQKWSMPLYWQKIDNEFYNFGLHGLSPLIANEPVSHISYYEAEAYARWRGCRLPTEFEWEIAAKQIQTSEANLAENAIFHPLSAKNDSGMHQLIGDLWEWTASPYLPYPRYQPFDGALGEYNAKFMNNQMVLRGGSCITPRNHIRTTYRNFFQQDKRWVFSGIRLAKDC